MKQLTEGRGADYAFEARLFRRWHSPLALVRNGGMALQVSGYQRLHLCPNALVYVEQDLHHAPLRRLCARTGFPAHFPTLPGGELRLDELVTRTYQLDQLGTAIDDMLSGRNAKGVIIFD